MLEIDESRIAEIKESIDMLEDSSLQNLPFNVLERRANKTTKLLITSGESSEIAGRNRWFDFEFRELVAVTKIVVNTRGFQTFHSFEFKLVLSDGTTRELFLKPDGDKYVLEVFSLCKSISFKPPSVMFFSTYVTSVVIEGIPSSDLQKSLRTLSTIQEYEDEAIAIIDGHLEKAKGLIDSANRLNSEKDSVIKEIANLKSVVARNKKSIDEYALKKNEFIAQNSALDTAISDQKTQLESLRNQFSSLTTQKDNVTSDISKLNTQLSDLRKDINIFPSEITGFAKQASRTGWQYFALSAVPIIIMTFMFYKLIDGAADLTTVLDLHPEAKIQDILLSRAPYVTIAIAIITACYQLAHAFFLELMRINTQRLNLTKISIIARDVTSSAEYGLDLTEAERFKLHAELKMELLRDHMKEYLSKDFKTNLPTKIIQIIPGRTTASKQSDHPSD